MRDTNFIVGRYLWPYLSRLGRRLFPVNNLRRSLAFGMLWGWMPCGFVYTVLIMASLSLDPWQAMATMLAFGSGTLPALLVSTFGAQRFQTMIEQVFMRRMAGSMLLLCAALTLSGPWLMGSMTPWMHHWVPFDCTALLLVN